MMFAKLVFTFDSTAMISSVMEHELSITMITSTGRLSRLAIDVERAPAVREHGAHSALTTCEGQDETGSESAHERALYTGRLV